MGPSKFRKAIGSVKDHTSIGLAKVGSSSSSIAALEVAVVKATRHEEQPPEDRHINEILSLTSYSNNLVSACVAIIARRLDRTKNWVVALKALVLVHRLLSKGGRAYEQEIFFSTRRGTRYLNMSDFRDASTSFGKSCDYSAFVRTYALNMDERLEFRMQGFRGKRGGYGYHLSLDDGGCELVVAAGPSPVRDLKIESVFSRTHHLIQLLERFLACRPTGAAKHNRVVVVALYPIVQESFQLCQDVTEITGTLVDRFMQLAVPDMVRVNEIFSRMSKQLDELDRFYDWCKAIRIIRSSECPRVEKISQKKLETMDQLIQQKSALLRIGRARSPEPEEETTVVMEELSLVPSQGFVPEHEKENESEENTTEITNQADETTKGSDQEIIGDLLNLGEDLASTGPRGDELALALFGDDVREITSTDPWEPFKESAAASDWEMALVQSASRWSNRKASFTGGLDTMILDSMYRQGGANTEFPGGTGSASSVVTLGGGAGVLALPAPPGGGDPFAASVGVAPPAYVQMSEMEKKQRLLVEEQLVWQQYARGQQQNSYPYVAMW